MTRRFYLLKLWLNDIQLRIVSSWNIRARAFLEGRKRTFREIVPDMAGCQSKRIWMHCDSLGEFEQGLPLLERIRVSFPRYKIVVTFYTPEGYEVHRKCSSVDYAYLLPSDSNAHAEKLINQLKPALVFWVKNRFWMFYLLELNRRKIPVLLVSGLFGENPDFLRWYGHAARQMLACFSHLFLQTDSSLDILSGTGFQQRASISGDTRFDRVIEIASQPENLESIEAFCGSLKPVIVAGSTWEEDNEELDHYANAHPEIRFIIAPHKIDPENLMATKKLFKRSIYYSDWILEKDRESVQANVLIVDNFGLLAKIYRYATICYIGGGFVDNGVHSVLEAAVYGKPLVFGPVIDEYIEALDLVECGGAIVVDSALEVEETFNRLLTSDQEYFERGEASRNYVFSKKGATEKILEYIYEKRLLTN